MKLLINCSNNLGGGGLQVALSFLSECKIIEDNTYIVLLNTNIAKQINIDDFDKDIFSFELIRNNNYFGLSKKLNRIEKKYKPDVVFSVFGPTYWKPKASHVMGFAIPHYIYSEIPFLSKSCFKDRVIFLLKKIIHLFYLYNEANVVICETEDATNRCKKLFNRNTKFYTVSNICSSTYLDKILQKEIVKLPINTTEFRYLLFSKYYPHKNIELLIPIIDKLIELKVTNIKFVLTLEEDKYNELFSSKYKEFIYNVGFVPVNEGPALYNECNALFLPTMLECFSATFPEAMAMKKPIITSNYSFTKTVCGDAALYCNINSIEDMVNKIVTLAKNKKLQSELISKGNNRLAEFKTPKQRAENYIRVCKTTIATK